LVLDGEKKATVVTEQEADSFLRLDDNFIIDQKSVFKQLSILLGGLETASQGFVRSFL